MLSRCIEWSLRHVFLVVLTTVFVVAAGIYAIVHTPVDALPDLSDVQVIVYTEYPGQGPQVVEDQVTYPLSTAMLSVPRSKVVRGFSNFGVSFVYVIFEDGTDIYWARSRVLEYLNFAARPRTARSFTSVRVLRWSQYNWTRSRHDPPGLRLDGWWA
jgi:Cu(I)/Ag(I) efflux system membrane protein CusA/SilA